MGHNRGTSASGGATSGFKHKNHNNLNGRKHIPGSQSNTSQRLSNSMLPPNSGGHQRGQTWSNMVKQIKRGHQRFIKLFIFLSYNGDPK